MKYLLLFLASCATVDYPTDQVYHSWRSRAYVGCTQQARSVCDGLPAWYDECLHTVYSGCARGFK